MRIIISLIILLFGVFSSLKAHDIHVSVTDIEISEDGKIEVVVKVFLDDLMKSLGLELGAELPDDYTSSDEMITKFLGENLIVHVNGKPISFALEDTTPSSPAVWIRMTSTIEEEIETVVIDNKILIELFDDQANMLNVSFKGENYSELLDADSTSYSLPVGK